MIMDTDTSILLNTLNSFQVCFYDMPGSTQGKLLCKYWTKMFSEIAFWFWFANILPNF